MARKPKPIFWITVLFVCAALVALALYRMGMIGGADKTSGVASDLLDTVGSPGGKPLEILFYSSSAKKNWVDEMTGVFNGGKLLSVKYSTNTIPNNRPEKGDFPSSLVHPRVKVYIIYLIRRFVINWPFKWGLGPCSAPILVSFGLNGRYTYARLYVYSD